MKTQQLVAISVFGMLLSAPCIVLAATVAGSAEMPKGPEQMPDKAAPGREEVQGEGVLNTVDQQKRVANIQHGAIAALGWPAMTMDFAIAAGVDLTAVRPGQKILFSIAKMSNGMYQVIKMTLKP